MRIHGAAAVLPAIEAPGYFVKCIANPTDVVFFPGSVQHRDVKVAGVSYEDDYRGNALAATLASSMIDVRFHARYDDAQVAAIFRSILSAPEVAVLAGFGVRYQGRSVITGTNQG